MKEKCKIKCVNIEEELLKYIDLNKKELDHMMIEKLKDSLTVLKTKLQEIKKRDNKRTRNGTKWQKISKRFRNRKKLMS